MIINSHLSNLKSISITSSSFKKRLLVSRETMLNLQTILRKNIDSEVVIISTNNGLEVFYHSKKNFSNYIKAELLLLLKNKKVVTFKNYTKGRTVYLNFKNTVATFAQYPQLFLAYAKKLAHLKKTNTTSKVVMPLLLSFYEKSLKKLESKGRFPHAKNVNKTRTSNYTVVSFENGILQRITANLLLKKHLN